MEKDTLRMQFLSGVITESEYKAIINKEIEDAEKSSLNESMIGGIVGIGAINQIPPRAKADYETAFEHFLGGKYGLNEEMEVMVDSNMLKSYFNELISLADDMEYTPEMVDELKNLKNTLQGGKISVENALDLMQQTVDITEDDIDAVEALSQAVDNDDAIIDKAREIYGLDESKEVEEDFKFGGKNGLTMAGDEPTPVKVNKVKQELSGIASTMEDVFQAFNKEVQQKYPDIFQDKNLLSRIEMMAQQIKRLKNEVKGLNEVEIEEAEMPAIDSKIANDPDFQKLASYFKQNPDKAEDVKDELKTLEENWIKKDKGYLMQDGVDQTYVYFKDNKYYKEQSLPDGSGFVKYKTDEISKEEFQSIKKEYWKEKLVTIGLGAAAVGLLGAVMAGPLGAMDPGNILQAALIAAGFGGAAASIFE